MARGKMHLADADALRPKLDRKFAKDGLIQFNSISSIDAD
jgi:hypothetical protein